MYQAHTLHILFLAFIYVNGLCLEINLIGFVYWGHYLPNYINFTTMK